MRCDDCLDDLPSRHFVVVDPDDVADAGAVEWDEKRLCADCAGWYSNAMEVTE